MTRNGANADNQLPAGGLETGRGFVGPGGTSGGTGSFLLGLILAAVGTYLIMNQAIVSSGYWTWFGPQTFGLTLVPLLLGLAVLFYDGRSLLGWLLSLVGVVIIVAGILVNLRLYFQATTVFNTVLMFGLFAVGLGLMARSLRPR
jgi:hypothetical protein